MVRHNLSGGVCVRGCARVCMCMCMCTHVLINGKNRGNAGGVYLKEIAGMQLLDLA